MILYFSGTGNSRYVATQIAKEAEDEIISVNSRIKAGDYSSVKSDKPIVFVGPVYAGRFPRIMDDYIKKVDFVGCKDVYFVATCAATPWKTVSYAEKICKEKGFKSLGFNSLVMPQGYIAGGGTQPKEVNDKILSEAAPRIKAISELIAKNKPLPTEKAGNAIMSTLINPMMYSMMITSKPFAVTSKCNGCGKCVDRCPLNNIKMINSKPEWGRDCTHCMACIAGCPQEAIEYGKKTVGKPRYYLGEK